MQANPIKLLRLLGDNDTVFKVPVYQRNYEWNEEQVKQYFEDIEKIIESNFEKNHFMGTIVYVQNEIEDLMTERLLIDGQQRVTTSILILKALVDIKSEDKNIDINDESIIEKYLINKHANQNSRFKLQPVESDTIHYIELMDGNKTDSKIYENYELLKRLLLESTSSIEEIYKALMYIDIVYISLDRDENPQIIFESLNSTGLTLTQSDLIRNFILMGLGYEEQTLLYRKYWTKIEKLLPNNIISDYVRDFLTMKEGRVPNKNKVYDAFKSYYFEYKYNAEQILEELLTYANYYNEIRNSNTNTKNINIQLEKINNIRSTVTYPYLLELFDDYYNTRLINEIDFEEVLKIIVSYIYRRNVCGIPTNALNKIFTVMPRDTKRNRDKGFKYVDALIDFLMSKTGSGIFPRDEEFKNGFINGNMYSKTHGFTKLVLYDIERYRHKEVVNIDDLTIEHIMPQMLTAEWNIELGQNSYDVYRLYKDTIGNLTLTKYNSEMANRSFDKKKKYYKNSNIFTTRDIANYDIWQEKSILNRAEDLFDIAKDIWKLPKDDYQAIGKERLIPHEEYSIKDDLIVTGYTPKAISFDGDRVAVNTWRNMLIETCKYLYKLDNELFKSLTEKNNFKNIISYNKEELRSPKEVAKGIYIQTHHSAKDILNYIVIFTEEFGISDLVYFEVN